VGETGTTFLSCERVKIGPQRSGSPSQSTRLDERGALTPAIWALRACSQGRHRAETKKSAKVIAWAAMERDGPIRAQRVK
jgi:hypothetical protein